MQNASRLFTVAVISFAPLVTGCHGDHDNDNRARDHYDHSAPDASHADHPTHAQQSQTYDRR